MSKSAGTTKTTSTTGLPAMQMPYAEELLRRARSQFEAGPTSFFPGSTVAPLSREEYAAGQYIGEKAPLMGATVENTMLPAIQFGAKAYDVANNPYLAKAAQAAIDPVFQTLRESVLPGIRHEAVAAGGYGGSRGSLAEALATERATKAALDATSGMYSNAYQEGLGTSLQAAGMVPGMNEAWAFPAALVSGVGAQQRAQEQAKINEEIARWEYNQNAPRTALAEYGRLIGLPVGGTATSEVQATPTGSAQQISAAGLSLLPWLLKLFGVGG